MKKKTFLDDEPKSVPGSDPEALLRKSQELSVLSCIPVDEILSNLFFQQTEDCSTVRLVIVLDKIK